MARIRNAAFSLLTAPDQSLPPTSLLNRWIQTALTTLHTNFTTLHAAAPHTRCSPTERKLPTTADTFFPALAANHLSPVLLQHYLVKQATQLRYHAAVEEAHQSDSTQRVAHLKAYAAPHASRWKIVIPSCTAHTLPAAAAAAAHFTVSARHNLGLRPYRIVLPDDCASCGVRDAIRADPWHHLSCNSHKRQEINLRHNSVVNALFYHADHAGAAACKEPQGLSTEDGRRPDLHIILPGTSVDEVYWCLCSCWMRSDDRLHGSTQVEWRGGVDLLSLQGA